jgi:hypothetical protein
MPVTTVNKKSPVSSNRSSPLWIDDSDVSVTRSVSSQPTPILRIPWTPPPADRPAVGWPAVG